MSDVTPLRRNREFLLLQAGQVVSTFGSRMSAVAYPLLALAVTHSAARAGYVSAVTLVPLLVFSLVAGVTADRFERRRQMIAADVLGAAALATLAGLALVHRTPLWLILVVAFVDSTTSTFYIVAAQGAFRAVVPASQLASAASTVQGRAAVVRLAAPPVGGALLGLARSLPFLADATSYAFSTASLLLMRTRFQEERERGTATLRRELAEGVGFFLRIPFLRVTILMIMVSNFTISGIQLAVIVLAKRAGLSSAAVGGLVALVGASTLLGSVASPLLRRVLSLNRIMLSELWAALGYTAFLVWPNPYVLAVAFAVQAFCFPNTDSAVAAYSYALIPDRLIGRGMAASNTLRVAAAPLGPLAAGLLLSVSPRVAIGALMGVTLLAAVVGTSVKAIRLAPPLEELTGQTVGMTAEHGHDGDCHGTVGLAGSGDWDERYAARERIWSGQPNGALVVEVGDEVPARALDVGCGEGADAVWLAQRGWQVTALDVSRVALDRAGTAAAAAGVDVRWMHAGLLDAEISHESFDLVTAQYPALPRNEGGDTVHALLAAVAPGGTLLVVHHADFDEERAKEHGCDPADYVSREDIMSALGEAWEVVVDERRPRQVSADSGGAHHTHDLVLRARRHS